MCVVSAMVDYGRTYIPLTTWTQDTYSEFQEILLRLEELDRKLEQPDCHDPKKAEWMKEVEERLNRLENKPSRLTRMGARQRR